MLIGVALQTAAQNIGMFVSCRITTIAPNTNNTDWCPILDRFRSHLCCYLGASAHYRARLPYPPCAIDFALQLILVPRFHRCRLDDIRNLPHCEQLVLEDS